MTTTLERTLPAQGPPGIARSPVLTILLTLVTLGLWSFVWVWQVHRDYTRFTGDGIGPWLGLLVSIVVAPVTWFLIPSETKRLYERAGLPSPVSAAKGFWLLLPIIGAFIWYFEVQGALNAYWQRHALAATR